MRSDDHRADNLLLRLFSYTPRLGRTPLEDFCTEALAWCLRNHDAFQREFLECLNLQVRDRGRVTIATQNSYESDGDAEGEGDSDAGRFDLLIQIDGDEIFAIIETKVGAAFGVDQLHRYREELKRQQRVVGFKRGILITLTDRSDESTGADVHRTWSVVQRLLESQVASERGSDHATEICIEFAEFLKEKGLGPMNVPEIASKPLNEWVAGMKLRARLEGILKSIRNDSELVRVLGRKRIAFEENRDGTAWLGFYGNQQDFWIGFEFRQETEKTRAFMLVQKAVTGDRRKEFPTMQPEYADGKTWINIERCLDNEMDGNGEKIKEWLLSSAKSLVETH